MIEEAIRYDVGILYTATPEVILFAKLLRGRKKIDAEKLRDAFLHICAEEYKRGVLEGKGDIG